MNIICWLRICRYDRTGVEWRTESGRQVGEPVDGLGWVQQDGRGQNRIKAILVGRCPGQDIFTLFSCPLLRDVQRKGKSELSGRKGKKELAITGHPLGAQELSRVLGTQTYETALLSCLHGCAS